MIEVNVDIAVIGGGPAGLAAALEARRAGAGKVLLIERDKRLGGILQQCIHDGFGIHRFGKRLSGTEYAQRFSDELSETDIELKLDTIVLEVTEDKNIYACNKEEGLLNIKAGAIILTMGCRERPASQVFIYGSRPAGVLTAGAVQRYINIEGCLPGKRAVILGSGDIGLIMARRMTLEGMYVEGVYEVMSNLGGLTRNKVQCLDDFDIPLHLSTTVVRVHGNKRLEAVTVAEVGPDRKVIAGTERKIDCDLLVLAVGLIPENELSRKAGTLIDGRTKGPVLDNGFMTSIPGLFAAGNVGVVFDLVDYVSQSAEIAADAAAAYVKKLKEKGEAALSEKREYREVKCGENVAFAVPQRLCGDGKNTIFFLRVTKPIKSAKLVCTSDGREVFSRSCRFAAPPEMLSFSVGDTKLGETEISVKEVSEK